MSKNAEPGKHNVDISKIVNLENSRYGNVERKCNLTLLRMLEDGLHADVTINANGGSVKAHKSVLASISPVFADMFKHQMKDQLTSTVNLPEISIRGLRLFLALVYVLDDNTVAPEEFKKSIDKHFDELLEACWKYQVKRLEPTISARLRVHLSLENCWDYLHRSVALSDFRGIDNDDLLIAPGPFAECWFYMSECYKEVIKSERFISEMQTNPKIVQLFLKYGSP